MNKMPYIVCYNMLQGRELFISVQGIYPDYHSAEQWVGQKKGYQIIELPSKSGAIEHIIEWKLQSSH